MRIKIVGAGMAGLLAANMLARQKPLVVESQPVLPNNHSAVLRFRTPAVGDVLGIPFRKVSLIKDTLPWLNPVADALAYSRKNTGVMRSDRSVTAGLVTADRWVAPPDLIERMAEDVSIRYSTVADFKSSGTTAYISTIPMPALMAALDYPIKPAFQYRPGINIRARVADCDAYVSLVIPSPATPVSRVSITGDELIIEIAGTEFSGAEFNDVLKVACDVLGLHRTQLSEVSSHTSQYAKIVPIDDKERRDFIYWASTRHAVYSLGRFATWKPGLLLDDLIKDVRMIEKMILGGSHYDLAKSQ